MDRISTLSESVSKISTETGGVGVAGGGGGADLNSHHMHNHVRPATSEAGVMAKKSVEEELELATVNKSKMDSKQPNRVKTNNFFRMMNNKTNVLTSPR